MPKTVAFIPLRGGSKSVPLKNIKPIAGKPLAQWTIEAALGATHIDEVVVSTDSQLIKETLSSIDSPKLRFFDRSAENASDTASTESAMLEYFDHHPCDRVFLIQATSPLTTSADLDAACTTLEKGFDTVMSVVRQKRFYWRENADKSISPINYDPASRPRRQDFEGTFVENGAFYLTTYEALVRTRVRLSGRVGFCEMSEEHFVEIDEPADWVHVERLLLAQKR